MFEKGKAGSIILISNELLNQVKQILQILLPIWVLKSKHLPITNLLYFITRTRLGSEFTEIAIIYPLWSGMWKESIDIDGEQVIFDN